MQEQMQVIVRVRPMSWLESENTERTVVHPCEDQQQLLLSESMYGTSMGSKTFRFTSVLPACATQSDVFDRVEPLLRSALEGFNCTIFTYGQTGTGENLYVCI